MVHHNNSLLRYEASERVDIEMNAPVFKRAALVDYLLHGYDTRLKGWGTDVLFRNYLNAGYHKVAVIDAVEITNPIRRGAKQDKRDIVDFVGTNAVRERAF